MGEWNPYIEEKDQAHPECAGKAMAIEASRRLANQYSERQRNHP